MEYYIQTKQIKNLQTTNTQHLAAPPSTPSSKQFVLDI